MTDHLGLIILDGWGIGDKGRSDAVYNAETPFMDALMANHPNARLIACGEDVGLPEGQMGNSEVGHLNIGAGRIVYQELTRINKSIREGAFFEHPVLLEAIQKAKDNNVNLHLMGLVSKGGVHSSQDHLYALCDLAHRNGLKNVFIHAFTDGRDCDPKSGCGYFQELETHLSRSTGRIASIIGRYFAMDRDNRWERVKKAYDLLVHGRGNHFSEMEEVFKSSYELGVTDEFIEPWVCCEKGKPIATIQPGDVVISFNFRTDRPREITQVLTQSDLHEFNMHRMDLHYYTMTNYDASFKDIHVIFEKDNLYNTLGEVLAKLDRSQVRIAETEKYPHVTFFFSGGREEPFTHENRILVNSPKVATYDLQPEMSAPEVKNSILECMQKERPHFFCLNFANPDMVGHTGVYDAIVKAVETVDGCLNEVVTAGLALDYELLIIADHGNADMAINPDGTPNTAHSLNPVPIILVSKEKGIKLHDGILADVAPTILRRLGIAAPIEMTGQSLV
jgi:2,3-bisphosphoglycerate-independent phosphoglycerate mutase